MDKITRQVYELKPGFKQIVVEVDRDVIHKGPQAVDIWDFGQEGLNLPDK